jgi:uncharacterized protein (TIGR02265 family)
MSGLAEPQFTGSKPLPIAQRWVVFDHTVEGLFLVALRGRLSATAESSLRKVGLDLSKKLLPAYPFEVWRQCLEIVATDLYPMHPRPEAWRRLGHDMVRGMCQTVLGRAMVGVSRLLGPLRALRRLNHTLRSADNYVEAHITELSPTCCLVWINEVMGQPGYYQGILEASLATMGARGARVRLCSSEGTSATYRVEWEP